MVSKKPSSKTKARTHQSSQADIGLVRLLRVSSSAFACKVESVPDECADGDEWETIEGEDFTFLFIERTWGSGLLGASQRCFSSRPSLCFVSCHESYNNGRGKAEHAPQSKIGNLLRDSTLAPGISKQRSGVIFGDYGHVSCKSMRTSRLARVYLFFAPNPLSCTRLLQVACPCFCSACQNR